MKILITLIIFMTIVSVTDTYGQLPKSEIPKIIKSLKLELKNKTTKIIKTEAELKSMIKLLNYNLNKDSIFPYHQYDSVVFLVLENSLTFEGNLDDRKIVKTKTLDKKQINQLLVLINNPLNFEWGECGTPVREGFVEFMHDGKVIATIDFACSYGQLFCEPENILIRWGVLNDKGNAILDDIELWN